MIGKKVRWLLIQLGWDGEPVYSYGLVLDEGKDNYLIRQADYTGKYTYVTKRKEDVELAK